jgi:hypothetical protein
VAHAAREGFALLLAATKFGGVPELQGRGRANRTLNGCDLPTPLRRGEVTRLFPAGNDRGDERVLREAEKAIAPGVLKNVVLDEENSIFEELTHI